MRKERCKFADVINARQYLFTADKYILQQKVPHCIKMQKSKYVAYQAPHKGIHTHFTSKWEKTVIRKRREGEQTACYAIWRSV